MPEKDEPETSSANVPKNTSLPSMQGLKKTAKIPKVSELKEQEVALKATPSAEKEENKPSDKLNDDLIDPEKLEAVWQEYARKKKKEGKDQLFMILNQPYHFEEKNIEIILSSPLQEDLINEYRTDIVQFLRHQLHNSFITISTRLVKPEAKKMIYTPQEKFNYLAEKHPSLLDLKERLGLDPDF